VRKLLPSLLAFSFLRRAARARPFAEAGRCPLTTALGPVKSFRTASSIACGSAAGLSCGGKPSAVSLAWFLSCRMQRRHLVRGEGVGEGKIIGGWTHRHGSGPMPAPGRAPAALVTVCMAWGWHPDLPREPGPAGTGLGRTHQLMAGFPPPVDFCP